MYEKNLQIPCSHPYVAWKKIEKLVDKRLKFEYGNVKSFIYYSGVFTSLEF